MRSSAADTQGQAADGFGYQADRAVLLVDLALEAVGAAARRLPTCGVLRSSMGNCGILGPTQRRPPQADECRGG